MPARSVWALHIDFTDDDPLFSESDDSDFDLKSVDNSYHAVHHDPRLGLHHALWISIAIFYLLPGHDDGFPGGPPSPSQVLPLAVCTATVLALMVSMYTVWAGALYTVVWAIMLGLSQYA